MYSSPAAAVLSDENLVKIVNFLLKHTPAVNNQNDIKEECLLNHPPSNEVPYTMTF